MLRNLNELLTEALYWVPALIIALSFHEYAHGKAADLLGDPTPRNQGRLTLNPLKHVDPIGLLMLILVKFGWAKPVQVNPLFFRGERRRGMLKVALAGPATNFILALIAGIGLTICAELGRLGSGVFYHLFMFFLYLLIYNVNLGVFNLLPVPPLDGSKILFNLLPPKYSGFLYDIERYGSLILLVLLITGLYRYFLEPVAGFLITSILYLADLLVLPFF